MMRERPQEERQAGAVGPFRCSLANNGVEPRPRFSLCCFSFADLTTSNLCLGSTATPKRLYYLMLLVFSPKGTTRLGGGRGGNDPFRPLDPSRFTILSEGISESGLRLL